MAKLKHLPTISLVIALCALSCHVYGQNEDEQTPTQLKLLKQMAQHSLKAFQKENPFQNEVDQTPIVVSAISNFWIMGLKDKLLKREKLVPETVPEKDPQAPPPITEPEPEVPPVDIETQLKFIKQMARDAWRGFRKSNPNQHGFGYASTVISSMSTFWVMDLKDEFEDARQWVVEKFNLSRIQGDLDTYHVVNHFAAGLLSCYALTQDEMFLKKAKDVVDTVLPVYSSPTGLPYQVLNLKTGRVKGLKIDMFHATPPQIIYQYLSDATYDGTYKNISDKIKAFWREKDDSNPSTGPLLRLDVETGEWRDYSKAMSWYSSTFYSYLVKAFIASNGKDPLSIGLFEQAMDSNLAYDLVVQHGDLVFVREVDTLLNTKHNRMGGYSCSFPAIWALASKAIKDNLSNITATPDDRKEKACDLNRALLYGQLARGLEKTCSGVAHRTKTGLIPETFTFNENGEEMYSEKDGNQYRLTPELAETYFIMSRLTGLQVYRDNAWRMAQAIHRHARDPKTGAYGTVGTVLQLPTWRTRDLKYEFIGATLKYLYLALADKSVLPLDQWVFNDMGHPMPVCEKNPVYPKCYF